MQAIEICEGMTLHFAASDKFNTTAAGILLRRELNREEAAKNALLCGVLRMGCERYKNIRAMNERLEEMYGMVFNIDIMKKGDEQIIELYSEILGETALVKEGLTFMFSVLFRPLICSGSSFDKAYVELAVQSLAKQMDGRMDDKKEYAKLRCIEEMFKGEPYGIYADGYKEDLENITGEQLYNHYKKIILESPIDIVIAGGVSQDEIVKFIKDNFKFSRNGTVNPKQRGVKKQTDKPCTVEENMEVAQGKLCVGLSSGVKLDEKGFCHLLVGNEIFGGGANSRLFMNVREKENLCYYINSYALRFKGILLVQSGVEEKNLEKTVEMINKELKEVKSGNFDDDEVKMAKANLSYSFRAIEDKTPAIMDFYYSRYILGENVTVNNTVSFINETTKDDIINIFKKIDIDTIYFMRSETA